MKPLTSLGLVVLFLLAAVASPALGQAEKPTLTGVVAVKGNEPFTYLALTDQAGRDWKLVGAKAQELAVHQNAKVRVEVKSLPDRPASPLVTPEVEVTGYRLLE